MEGYLKYAYEYIKLFLLKEILIYDNYIGILWKLIVFIYKR